jgi:hypothetical protein
MHKLFVAAIAAASLTLPQMAFAQESPPPQKQQSLQSRVKANLEQAGFTDVQIMARSFLVQAKDKDGNPVMMVINPDSITSVTELSGGQQAPAASQSSNTGAAVASNDVNLTSAQRHDLWQGLGKQAAKESTPAGFTAKVGEVVPSSIKLQAVPATLGTQIPAVKSYDYAFLQSGLLIVDPSSKNIIDIITQ